MVYLRGFEKVILDAGSFSLTLLLIFSFFFYKKNLIEANKINILLFCIIFFTIQPFFFNSVLIDPYKIYDQFKYVSELDFSDFENNNLV